MISDTSYAELHDFAAAMGIPPRAFERDHYDVIAERYDAVVAAGARRASSRQIVIMLHRAGLRRRHRSVLAPPLGRVWPPPLVPGDLVAVVAPSGPVAAERLARGVAPGRVVGAPGPTVAAGAEHVRATDVPGRR